MQIFFIVFNLNNLLTTRKQNRGPQGGAFDKELDYFRTVIGSGQVVKGLELAMMDMKPGGVRQVRSS